MSTDPMGFVVFRSSAEGLLRATAVQRHRPMDRALENERGEVIAVRDAGDPVLGSTPHCAKTRTNQFFIVGR